jgi:hypothetical protein
VFEQGKATHVKRIEGSIWCMNAVLKGHFTMKWYADNHGLAGFANTRDSRTDCNAELKTIGEEVFLIATKQINVGEEIFAFYDRSAEIALKKERKRAAEARLAKKKGKKAKTSSR